MFFGTGSAPRGHSAASAADDDRRVIVVGSGPTGAMAALTLVRRGIPVTMLESGSDLPEGRLVRVMGQNVYRRWPGASESLPYVASRDPDTFWHQALAPGGLSNYWTGAVPRFAPQDFYEGERLHERYRWPVTYDELAPYYDRVEGLLGVVGSKVGVPNLPAPSRVSHVDLPGDWRRVAAVAESLGQGVVRVPLAEGGHWAKRNTGAAFNSYDRIVRRLKGHPYFRLHLGTHALRLEWNPRRRQVDAVVCYDRSTRSERRLVGAAVVVAAGPLGSTKLLLQSRCSDFPDGLGNTEGVLGRYLHDHPNDWCVAELDRPLSRTGHPAYVTRAPYARSKPLLAASFTFGPESVRDRVLSVLPLKATRFGVVTFGTMIPTEGNYVRLSPERKDQFGLPMLDIHIAFGPDVESGLAAARERLLAIFDAAGHKCTLHCSVPRLVPGFAAHFGGSVRMHASPRHGVLDGWNRLHAVPNVLVVDASAFTTGVEKNPTLTAMALAARAADSLAGSLKSEGVVRAVPALR